jgi:hypothetical protein
MAAAVFREDTPEGTEAQERAKDERDFVWDGVAVKTSRTEAKAGRPKREGQTNRTLATALMRTLKGTVIPWEEHPSR